MKNLTRVASMLALAALAQSGVQAQVNDNWMNADGKLVWLNGTSEHCWRNNFWTPATAAKKVENLKGSKAFPHQNCDGALLPPPPPPPPAAPPVTAMPDAKPAAPVTPPAPPKPIVEKVTYAADAFFDFDKAVLKPEAKVKLDDLSSKMGAINLEVIIAVGHTDSVGSDEYNQKLSEKRAEVVKGYLVSKGVAADKIETMGAGKTQPVPGVKCDDKLPKKKLIECLAPHRRFTIDVTAEPK